MHELLAKILDAHGGLERWNRYNKVEATIVSGGGFFPLKGVLQDPDPRCMTVWLHEERSSVTPYGVPNLQRQYRGRLQGGAAYFGVHRGGRPILDMLMVSIDFSEVAFL